jgi:hypothetical protein
LFIRIESCIHQIDYNAQRYSLDGIPDCPREGEY